MIFRGQGIILGWLFLLLLTPGAGQGTERSGPSFSGADYPGADGLFLFANKTILWNKDGPLVEDIHHSFMAFTPDGTRKAADFQFYLRTPEQQIQVVRAGTYRKEEGFVHIAASDVTDEILEEFGVENRKTEIRRRMFKLPRPGLNEISEVHIQRFSEAMRTGISGVEYLQSDEPMDQRTLRFILPAGKSLSLHLPEDRIETVMNYHRGEANVYTIQFRDVQAFSSGENGPPPDWIIEKLVYSSYADWNEASGDLQAKIAAAVERSPEIERLVSRLTVGIEGEEEKVERLAVFVSREIRSLDIPARLRGYTFQTPGEVIENGHGTGLDKAVLLAAMIQAVGWEAHLVLAGVNVRRDVPALEQLEWTFVKVLRPDGSNLWVDPSDRWGSPSWLPAPASLTGLEFEPNRAVVIDISPDHFSPSRAETGCRVRMKADGRAEIEVTSILSGFPARECRRLFSPLSLDEQNRAVLAVCRANYPDARLNRLSIAGLRPNESGQVRIDFQFSTAEFAVRQGSWLVVPWRLLPMPYLGVMRLWSQPERESDLFAGLPADYTWQTELEPPQGSVIAFLPETVEFSGDIFSAALSCGKLDESNLIRLTRELMIRRAVVPAADYEGLRREMNRIILAEGHFLLLTVAADAAGPSVN